MTDEGELLDIKEATRLLKASESSLRGWVAGQPSVVVLCQYDARTLSGLESGGSLDQKDDV